MRLGAGPESTLSTLPRLAWRIFFAAGSTGALCTPAASTGQLRGKQGGRGRTGTGVGRRGWTGGYIYNIKREISFGGSRGRAPREKLLFRVTVYFDPVAFVYCVGFWGSVHFFRLSRNGYFKIESRPDARLTLPRPNTMGLSGYLVPAVACVARHRFANEDRAVPRYNMIISTIKTGDSVEMP